MRNKIIMWAVICAACGALGVWLFGGWDGIYAALAPLLKFLAPILRIFGIGGKDKELEKLDHESALDLQDVKRRKKKLRETNNVSDLAAQLTASSKRRKRKRSKR